MRLRWIVLQYVTRILDWMVSDYLKLSITDHLAPDFGTDRDKLISVQPPGRTRSSSVVTITRPPSYSSLKPQIVHFDMHYPVFGINFMLPSVNIILIILHHTFPAVRNSPIDVAAYGVPSLVPT